MEAGEVVARIAADERQARDWALVLHAAGVQCRMIHDPRGWAVLVDARDAQRVEAALAAYDEDVRPETAAATVEYGPTSAGLVMAGLLLATRPFTGYRADGSAWFRAGEASARQILDGDIWRTVTALTLHADPAHLLGNVAAMVVLGTAVCRLLGPGLGASLMLASGAAGNAIAAWLGGAPHSSVGASTAIFGALGLLAGIAVMRRQVRMPRRRSWVPIAAGLALLGMLGTGERADLSAHLLGFGVGLGLGLGVRVYATPPPRARAQGILAVAAFVAVVGCWAIAVRGVAQQSGLRPAEQAERSRPLPQ